ncbi:alpha-2,8-polysialyltransferase family protein [Actinocorallia longicatena]|uniref:Alpha-2,8-polysialyltransferase family protein n=1 Tax=Actinocorallia longicatena TaxID=111803 RepID=A0ABP6QP08_9ACTN
MTQIFLASTLYGAMTVTAAIDAGRFGPRGLRRRILLVSNNAAIPELVDPLDAAPGFDTIAGRYDEIISWNEEIAPLHPSGWMPRTEDLVVWERFLRGRWNLGEPGAEPLELAVETIAAGPARALTSIFSDALITVYAEGLMSYGPTREGLPDGVGTRITRLLHLDLVPGLTPMLLSEHGVAPETIPDEAFVDVLDKMSGALSPLLGSVGELENPALIVGQYLAALEILTAQEEDELHVAMLRGVVARGHTTVLFKPHPASPVRATEHLTAEAVRLGAELLVIDQPVPAESWCAKVRPSLIVGSFSTALVTARHFYGIPAATVGTRNLLKVIAPYQNSNRVPVTIVDATLPHLAEDGTLSEPVLDDVAALTALLTAVGYAMRAAFLPDRRKEAEAWLAEHGTGPLSRYFKKRRLSSLGLPGGLPPAAARKATLLSAALPGGSRRRRLATLAATRLPGSPLRPAGEDD